MLLSCYDQTIATNYDQTNARKEKKVWEVMN